MPNSSRVFPAGKGGNPSAPRIGTATNLKGGSPLQSAATQTAPSTGAAPTTAQPPIRPPPDPFVLKSVEPFTDDDNITGFVDGQGNRIWHVDTSASAKAITFMSVGESTDFEYVVKWVKGANALTIVAAGGANVGGTATFVGTVAGDAYQFRSDGTEYHLVGLATNQGFLTSNSFSAFTASASFGNISVHGSATFSQTVAFLTSINVSGTASINTLVVVGTASLSTLTVTGTATFSATVVFAGEVRALGTLSVSATASVGALTIAGQPLTTDWTKIGSVGLSNVLSAAVSGSWTAYSTIKIEACYRVSTTGFDPFLQLSTDGGGTSFLSGSVVNQGAGTLNSAAVLTVDISTTHSAITVVQCSMQATGINAGFSSKYIAGLTVAHNGVYKMTGTITLGTLLFLSDWTFMTLKVTATANSGQVNYLSFSHRGNDGVTRTMSSGFMQVYGLK